MASVRDKSRAHFLGAFAATSTVVAGVSWTLTESYRDFAVYIVLTPLACLLGWMHARLWAWYQTAPH
jgi:hypothetical protein